MWRERLYALGLIGVYDNGIGFGNLSVRTAEGQGFIISGTQTGGLPRLSTEHYTQVVAYRIEENYVRCQGSIKASSESLTHAMIYEMDLGIRAVVHVHHEALWRRLMGKVPTTSKKIPYGTPEMACEVRQLYQKTDLRDKKILAMGGHREGLITFGRGLEEAGSLLVKLVNNHSL